TGTDAAGLRQQAAGAAPDLAAAGHEGLAGLGQLALAQGHDCIDVTRFGQSADFRAPVGKVGGEMLVVADYSLNTGDNGLTLEVSACGQWVRRPSCCWGW